MQVTVRQFLEAKLKLQDISIDDLFSHHKTTDYTHALGAIKGAKINNIPALLDQNLKQLHGAAETSRNIIFQALIFCYLKQGVKYIEEHVGGGRANSIVVLRDILKDLESRQS